MIAWLFGGSLLAMLLLMVPTWILGHLHPNKVEIHSAGLTARGPHPATKGMSAGALRAAFFGWTLLIAVLVIRAFTGAEGEPGVALGVVLVFASAVPGALAAILTNYVYAVARGRA